jgi:hypothetical protein
MADYQVSSGATAWFASAMGDARSRQLRDGWCSIEEGITPEMNFDEAEGAYFGSVWEKAGNRLPRRVWRCHHRHGSLTEASRCASAYGQL